jgi:hypothetical protein
LARFSEAWFMAAPTVWASPATSISLSCRLTTSTDEATEIANRFRIEGQPRCAVKKNSRSSRPVATAEISSDRNTDQSAR